MKKFSIIHLGIGNVGKEVITQISQQKETIERELNVSLEYIAKFTSKNLSKQILNAIQNAQLPFVLIDTTASDETIPYIAKALKHGGFAVLANKKPLSGKQKDFDLLDKLGGQQFFYECVVGAGLPVIHTLKELLLTGDKIVEIQGCLSGTLGFICSELEKGKKFSDAIKEAKAKGFTEPDPRDDLSGKDVARKALILSRLIGRKLELENISLVGLYPQKMQQLSTEDFLKNVHQLDPFYDAKAENAKRKNRVLRFVAKVNPQEYSVGLQEVDASSDIGSLKGPDNLIVLKTKRYDQNPLVIKGPGAGIAVTAAGVFGDILKACETL